ncbi:unnamed protein product [Microthlaspi erraticum]|uniref:Uncharacterized protein n=1 Tax=Microthlaspi erraticum TaxID=1685480 RepID=A0A6D2JY47_9BRAS|nr:unnamed protein product [Microthlaspi erraticum]
MRLIMSFLNPENQNLLHDSLEKMTHIQGSLRDAYNLIRDWILSNPYCQLPEPKALPQRHKLCVQRIGCIHDLVEKVNTRLEERAFAEGGAYEE